VLWLVLGFVFTVFVGLLVALMVQMLRADRRAAARLRGSELGGSLVRTVAGLRAREGADAMPMYPRGLRGRPRPVQGAVPGHRAGGA